MGISESYSKRLRVKLYSQPRVRPWPFGVLCAALLQMGCVEISGPSRIFTPCPESGCDPPRTCTLINPASAAIGYIWGVTAFFTLDQLVESSPRGTYVAILHVGEAAKLDAHASVVGPADCSHLITGVSWGTSDSTVATVQATGRTGAILTAVAPGEITLTADASFEGGVVRVPYVFGVGPYQLRAIRVVSK
jgi:hypothetical protein